MVSDSKVCKECRVRSRWELIKVETLNFRLKEAGVALGDYSATRTRETTDKCPMVTRVNQLGLGIGDHGGWFDRRDAGGRGVGGGDEGGSGAVVVRVVRAEAVWVADARTSVTVVARAAARTRVVRVECGCRYWGFFQYKKRLFSIQDISIYHYISRCYHCVLLCIIVNITIYHVPRRHMIFMISMIHNARHDIP